MVTIHKPKLVWRPRDVLEWMRSCLRQEGVPMFKTEFAGVPFADEKYTALGICWGGKGPELTFLWIGIPKKDWEIIKREEGEYRYFYSIFEKMEKKLKDLDVRIREIVEEKVLEWRRLGMEWEEILKKL